ncbi:glycosyltransferase [Methanocella arvoryzae]|uniref:Glycosyltransferase subfamily 4-like N-terminal domain-containing protein n=1 Tax=Methanocella arvoryzae (strain DSM 22066 / NBRC 105507 / MRE50) TaxID=351160 RepID=Q0W3D0_METAR|nr:glycosyltransferase [Methanocella arvoryzae]CAJ37113.1 conserved hypothetical protein [Methanocella arvoryzae MRE50]
MRIGVFINTAGQAHFFRNIVRQLEADGHEVAIVARNQGITCELLDELEIPYYPYSSTPDKSARITSFPWDILRAYRYLKEKRLDLIAGFGIYSTCAARMLRVPDITFCDDEPMIYPASYAVPFNFFRRFTGALVTPSSFRQALGKKQIRVSSYKELAYLHPNHFSPDRGVYQLLGLPEGSDYVLLRFNAFDAIHDVGITGFSGADKIGLVRELEKYAPVFISTYGEVPEEIRDRLLPVPKHRIHDVISFAKLVVTDTGTTTTEAAMLGTPAVRAMTFVKNDAGNWIELEKKYGLIYSYVEPGKAIEKAVELIQQPDLRERWKAKRERMLQDKIDMTSYMVWFIENYPESVTKVWHPATHHSYQPIVDAGTTP